MKRLLYGHKKYKLEIDDNIFIQLLNRLSTVKVKKYNNKSKIYISNLHDELLMLWLNRFFIAKGISDSNGEDVLSITNHCCIENEKIYQQLEVQRLCLQEKIKRNWWGFFQAILITMYVAIRRKNAQWIQNFRYKDVHIGEFIYDKIIAENDEFSISRISRNVGFKEMQWGIFIANILDKQFRKTPPSYMLVWDRGYDDGICAAFASKYGATVIETVVVKPVLKIGEKGEYNPYTHSCIANDLNKYLKLKGKMDNTEVDKNCSPSSLKNGNKDQELAYASDKWNGSKSETKKKLGIDNDNFCAAIMSHCLVDWVHCSEKLLFKDYYTWIRDTLEYVSNIENVNWLIKPHPMRKMYKNEEDVVFQLVQKYNRGNMYYISDEINTDAISNISDAIITVHGTAGAEFAMKGIPVILAGRSWYSYYGFTKNPQTKKEYFEELDRIVEFKKLSAEQIRTAKEIFFAYQEMYKVKADKLSDCFISTYREFYRNRETYFECNNKLAKRVIDFLDESDIESSEYYIEGNTHFSNNNFFR